MTDEAFLARVELLEAQVEDLKTRVGDVEEMVNDTSKAFKISMFSNLFGLLRGLEARAVAHTLLYLQMVNADIADEKKVQYQNMIRTVIIEGQDALMKIHAMSKQIGSLDDVEPDSLFKLPTEDCLLYTSPSPRD